MSDALLRRTLPPYLAQVGCCFTCGKASYLTRRDARRAGKTFHPDARSWVYRCGALWHVTTSKRPRSMFKTLADEPGNGNTTDAPVQGIDLTEADRG